MNITMVMSGGIGKRFGTAIPKQYNMIKGKPVIDYVIDACRRSSLTDAVVVVCDPQCVSFSKELENGNLDIVHNGPERCWSVYNGLNYIKDNYNCDKICILDAVAPFVYPKLIDDYFSKLDDYDCVITCQKITGELGNYEFEVFDRNDFYITQSPEAFNFRMLYDCFDPDAPTSEIANQLPKNAKRFLNFEFKNNLKITYDFELKYAELMIDYFKSKNVVSSKIYEKEDFITEGLRSYLLRKYKDETNNWLDFISQNYQKLFIKWGIESFVANQTSKFGLILNADSKTFGKIVLKFIPKFINRYDFEKNFYLSHKNTYLCPVMEFDDEFSALLLKQVQPAKYASFEDNVLLTKFWNTVIGSLVTYNESYIAVDYYGGLKKRMLNCSKVPFMKNEVSFVLKNAVHLYDNVFKNKKNYYIHGDLHEFNIIKNIDYYVAIDPIGFKAPAEFETARFIRNDILKNTGFGLKERFELLVNYFSKWFKRDLIIYAEYIDLAYTLYNSTFENDTPKQTEIMFDLLSTVSGYIANDKLKGNMN